MPRKPIRSTVVYSGWPRQSPGVPTLFRGLDSYEKLGVISEVGPPVLYSHPGMGGKFALYNLRKPRNDTMPFVRAGRAFIGDAWSNFQPRQFSVPVIGTDLQVKPGCTNMQKTLMENWSCVRADQLYIVTVECPIGVALVLEASVYMSDTKTKVRGVRWKPHVTPTIAFRVPYESPLSMQHRDHHPPGNSGLDLKITTVEDNTTEEVVTPLSMLIHSAMINLKCYGWTQPMVGLATVPLSLTFNAIPQVAYNGEIETLIDEPTLVRWEADAGTEVSGEDASSVPAIAAVVESSVTAQAPAVERVPKPRTKAPIKTAKNPVANLNTKWTKLKSIKIGLDDIGKSTQIDITAKDLVAPGENLNKTLRRFVWYSGGLNEAGTPTVLRVRAVVAKPLQLAGLLQWTTGSRPLPIVFQRIGGDAVEFDVVANVWQPPATPSVKGTPASWVRPWTKTISFLATFDVQVLTMNRTSAIKDMQVSLFYKPGRIKFQTPLKPRKPTPKASLIPAIRPMKDEDLSNDDKFHDAVYDLIEGWSVVEFQSTDDSEDVYPHVDLEESENITSREAFPDNGEGHMAPAGLQGEEWGLVNHDGFEEEVLDQQDFYTEIAQVKLTPGMKPLLIPLDLTKIEDVHGNSSNLKDNVITELWERYGHIMPAAGGQLGPVIGHYTLMFNVPTSARGRLAHVCVPADMDDVILGFDFAVTSILGIASTAISTIGGMLKSGAVSTIIKGAGDLLSGVFGGDSERESTHEITGPIHMDRIIQFIKNVGMGGTMDSNIWPWLVIQLLDGQGLGDGTLVHTGISMDIFKAARAVFDALVTPQSYIDTSGILYVAVDSVADLLIAVKGGPVEKRKRALNFVVHYVSVIKEKGIAEKYPVLLQQDYPDATVAQRRECIEFLQKIYARRNRPKLLCE